MTMLDKNQISMLKVLRDEAPKYSLLESYYDGDAPLPESAEGQNQAYSRFQSKSRLNLAQLSVAAVRERMVIDGFRTGADGDDNGDLIARRLWKANHLDYQSADLHTNFLKFGSAYAIVGKPNGANNPVVTVEDPRQVYARMDPAIPGRVIEAIKVFTEDEYHYFYCYRAEKVQVFVKDATEKALQPDGWELSSESPNTLDEVPVIKFTNADGRGEFEAYTDVIDRVNHMILQRMVISTTQAFRQRVLKGDFPTHDDAGNEIDYNGIFESSAGSLWMIPEGAAVEELAQADIAGILQAVRADIQDFAAVTRTPMHYFAPEGVNGSAEGAQLSREGLVFKTEDRITRATPGWSKVMSLLFKLAGDDERADLVDLEPLWRPAERYSLAERADASAKFQDVPFRSRMSLVAQFTPAEIAEMENQKAGEDLISSALFTGEEAPGDPPPAFDPAA
jgi:hypothetical protein